MWGCVLIPTSRCFTQNRNSETNTSQGKAGYIIVSIIFHYVWTYLNTSILFYVIRVVGYGFHERGKRKAEMF
jgi:hypothetical protein